MTPMIVIVLVILLGYYIYQVPREEIKEKELRKEQPVMIELMPKGTNNKPVICKVNDTIYFRVLGFSDYKKENLIELEGSNITWYKYKDEGVWENDIGIENTYCAPNTKGFFDVYINYKDKKIKTSCKCKIMVEV